MLNLYGIIYLKLFIDIDMHISKKRVLCLHYISLFEQKVISFVRLFNIDKRILH